jgi:hypothetical protein
MQMRKILIGANGNCMFVDACVIVQQYRSGKYNVKERKSKRPDNWTRSTCDDDDPAGACELNLGTEARV